MLAAVAVEQTLLLRLDLVAAQQLRQTKVVAAMAGAQD
jgi:hypothetical protein